MTLYALDDIEDAIDATRAFLWPFQRGRWLRLAVVVFFAGGAGGFNPFQFTGSGTPSTSDGPTSPPSTAPDLPSLGGPEIAIIATIAVVLLLLFLGFLFVGSVMEFVFVRSLREEEVTLRGYWRDHWRQGARLFGFRLVLTLLTLGLVVGVLAAVFAPLVLGGNVAALGLLVVAIPVLILVALVGGLLNGFTTMFVVPVMLLEERGVIASWRRFWSTLRGQWKQYLAYLFMSIVLNLAGGILTGLVLLVAALVVGIPLALLGLGGGALLSVSHLAGWTVIGVAVAAFVVAMFVLALLVAVPVQTFLRYYALLVLGDTNETFDAIPERRRALREPEPEG
ncbi:hypothetical protein C2R22_14875 [Salinigranum rubrum]|uniref:Glycerophosphoryl diester phosphodiesterase membrane domain-containing protein n=1 Tax=Salinigranum rubrum TaxID=755307 RepID=A0A2I8VNT3_9EURY|nr:hypothetical protein [Salinigranum rubrum]AUV82769.1 hypothetical protein C2R22_14875 [Salinigranum rubrum]